ncbi:Aste57867_14542 [Aphanomyces stellatus]|uniref:Aste57867_14542 protein n=1 Tax=Aphanomyces stellatus TaxID=120398 RepID=A0A485L3K0_9STRA|nr:hypothetical protein As57867_014488 [Aphanomyces stellatus]VFT91364.1 Aste57867_14542 [Aphanomyces stellatus]
MCEYWTLIVPTKSPAETMAECWLVVVPLGNDFYARLDCITFNRWWLCLACCLVHFCCGSIYTFSILADNLDVYFYGQVTKKCIRVWLTAYLCMGVSAALVGPALERRGPRTGLAYGTALVFLGHLLSQFAVIHRHYGLLMVGYGICVGLGFGVILIASISTIQKWFPDMRGLTSGVCVLFFGIGSGIFIKMATLMLDQPIGAIHIMAKGVGVEYFFLRIGLFLVVVLSLCTLVLRTPPASYTVNGRDIHNVPTQRAPNQSLIQDEYLNVGMTFVNYTVVQHELQGTEGYYFQQVKAMSLLQCIASTDFICLYVAFAANVTPILVLLPEIRRIATDILLLTTDEQVFSFFLYSFVGNLIGRLVSPLISDILVHIFYLNPAYARKIVFVALLCLQLIVLALLPYNIGNSKTFQWLASTLTSASGGGLAIMPSFITDMFGVYNSGTMYGIIWTSFSLGAVISSFLLSQFVFTVEGLSNQLHWMLILVAVGTFAMLFVRTNSIDRFFFGYQFTLFSKVIVQVPFQLSETDSDEIDLSTITPTPKLNDLSPNQFQDFMLWDAETDGKASGLP